MRFRIVTYNIHRWRGLDWRVRPDRIADVLREVDAEVVALQEVVADHLSYLVGRLSPMAYVFGPADTLRGHEYGNVVFSKLPLRSSMNHDVSVLRREGRRCLQVDIQLANDQLLHLFALHLGTSFFERRKQALKLASDQVLGNPGLSGPRLVIGDFNEWTRGLVTRTLSAQMQCANPSTHLRRRNTYPGVLPVLHLDHIYFDAPLRLRSMELYRTPVSLLASDHLPIVGEFEWDKEKT